MNFRCRKPLLWFVAILVVAQGGQSCSLAQSPTDILEGYRDAVSRLSTARYDALVNMYEEGGVFEQETWMKAQVWTTVSIGNDWRQKFRDRTCFQVGGRPSLYALDIERVRDGDGRLIESTLTYSPTKVFSEKDAFTAELGEPTREDLAIVLESNEKISDRIERAIQPIYGYLPGDGGHGIVDLMRDSGSLTHEGEVDIDGHSTQILQSIGGFGTHRLFIDTSNGFLPRRIVYVKHKADRYGSKGRRVEDFNVQPRKGLGSRFPKSPLIGVEYRIQDVVISEIGGMPVITEFEGLTTSTYANGETFKHRAFVELSNISWSPSKNELALTTEIQDGSRVIVRDAKGIHAEWQDGEVVDRVDQKVLRNLSDLNTAE